MSSERLYSSFYPAKFEKYSAQIFTTFVACSIVRLIMKCSFQPISSDFNLKFLRDVETHNWFPLAVPSLRAFHHCKSGAECRKIHSNATHYIVDDLIRFQDVMQVLAATNGIAIIIFCCDIYLNFYRKIPKNLSLGASYQVRKRRIITTIRNIFKFSENRRVILVLMPIEIADSLLSFMTSTAQLLFEKVRPLMTRTRDR